MPVRKTEQEFQALAAERGFEFLGIVRVASGRLQGRFRCHCGYEWSAYYHGVKRGEGCNRCGIKSCGDKQRHTADAYRALAAERNFMWLEQDVTSANNKTRFTWR